MFILYEQQKGETLKMFKSDCDKLKPDCLQLDITLVPLFYSMFNMRLKLNVVHLFQILPIPSQI